MRSARNQLILVGFLCQGLSWDDFLAPMGGVLLWYLCLTRLQGRLRVNAFTEVMLLILGSVGSLLAGWLTGHDTHFFIGNGLTLIQAARLTRELNHREKIFSILMACFQLGVASTFLFDLRFIPLFAAMVWLLPRSFMELESEKYSGLPAQSKTIYLWITAISILFFVAFPRVFMGTALPSSRSESAESGTMLDSMIDMTRNAGPESRRVLLQIQGEKLGYLRCYSLVDFDGTLWTMPRSRESHFLPGRGTNTSTQFYRRVKVKQTLYLGRVLPADGDVKRLNGNFFYNVMRNNQDALQCDSQWNTGNNFYEYWTDPTPKPEPLHEDQKQRLTHLPQQTDRLRQWITQIIGTETNSLASAHRIEQFLKTNFTYSAGAPVLKRLNPVDEFVFEQKKGHCERFASTLAVCLRMLNIPSRVVIGFMPRERGWSSSGTAVRLSDAHAWTEGYFDGIGWVTLDATPAATTPDGSFFLRDWYDAIDTAWNLHVVNFDSATQMSLASVPVQGWKNSGLWIRQHRPQIKLAAGGLALMFAIALLLRWRLISKITHRHSEAQAIADRYYRQFIKLLADHGFHRKAKQTPMEFLSTLPETPWRQDAQIVSTLFCEIRYGGRELTHQRETELRQALHRLKSALK